MSETYPTAEQYATVLKAPGIEKTDVTDERPHSLRLWRAFTEEMEVIVRHDGETSIGMYDVVSGSGRRYVVDLHELGACTCPDAEADRAPLCKHTLRVVLAVNLTAIPRPGDVLTPAYGDHLFARRRVLDARLNGREDRGHPLGTLPKRREAVAAALSALPEDARL